MSIVLLDECSFKFCTSVCVYKQLSVQGEVISDVIYISFSSFRPPKIFWTLLQAGTYYSRQVLALPEVYVIT